MSETTAKPLVGALLKGEPGPEKVTLEDLLVSTPLNAERFVAMFFDQPEFGNIRAPEDIHVHCDHGRCHGIRRHGRRNVEKFHLGGNLYYYYLVYICSNCTERFKVFALKATRQGPAVRSGLCTKVYQEPPFGHAIPKRLFQVIGEPNREHFLQARRAIARGLGIGAYAYYRRIVENAKFDLVEAVLEVAEATNAPTAQIQLMKRAQAETQFSKAIELLRDGSAIPATLLIDGHNPLALLHDALSEGIHQLDDGECLTRAQEAEVILCEIAERIQAALTERKAVKAALASIMNRKRDGAEPTAPKSPN